MMIAIWHLLIKNIHIVMCIFKNSMASMLKVLIPGAECGPTLDDPEANLNRPQRESVVRGPS